MTTFFLSLGLLLAMMIATIATGWSAGVLLRIRPLRGMRLEALVGNAFAGTGIWILVSGWCSYAGLSMRDICWPLAGTIFSIIFALGIGQSPSFRWRQFGAVSNLVFMAGCGVASALVLLPLLWCECAWFCWDTATYVSIGRWLQDRGFGLTPIDIDPDRLLTAHVRVYQFNGHRMGTTFLLALLQAFTGLDGMKIHPTMMAWGLLLNLGGIYLVSRWTFRLSRKNSSIAILFAAVAFNPLYASIYLGFLPQMFGTAYLSLAIALLSRATGSNFWSKGSAFLLSLTIATFLSVYNDMAPILGFIGFGFFATTFFRSIRDGNLKRFLHFSFWTVCGSLILGNIEWWRAWNAVKGQLGVVVGCHITWTDTEFWAFALGLLPFQWRQNLGPECLLLVVGCSALLFLGLLRLLGDRRSRVAGFGLVLFASMAVYFHRFAINPFTGEIGHTWSLFKLAKWAFPLLFVVQYAGLIFLLRYVPWKNRLLILAGMGVVAMSIPAHFRYARTETTSLVALSGSRQPLTEWAALHQRLKEIGDPLIYLLRDPHDLFISNWYAPYIFYPRPLVNGWYQASIERFPPPFSAQTVLLKWGPLPFGGEHSRLPSNMSRLDPTKSYIYHLESELPVEGGWGPSAVVAIGNQPAKFHLWLPKAGIYRFSCLGDSASTVPLRFVLADGTIRESTADASGAFEVEGVFPAGRAALTVQSLPDASNEAPVQISRGFLRMVAELPQLSTVPIP